MVSLKNHLNQYLHNFLCTLSSIWRIIVLKKKKRVLLGPFRHLRPIIAGDSSQSSRVVACVCMEAEIDGRLFVNF